MYEVAPYELALRWENNAAISTLNQGNVSEHEGRLCRLLDGCAERLQLDLRFASPVAGLSAFCVGLVCVDHVLVMSLVT
jgi:hypothetical protein